MKIQKSIIIWVALVLYVFILAGCGGAGVDKPVVEAPPPTPEPVKEPTIAELRKPVNKDPEMFKVTKVIQKFGRLRKKAITFEKYVEMKGSQSNTAINPDWFCDTYTLDVSENKHWITITFGTAQKVAEKDERVRQVLSGLPLETISLTMQVPEGKKYLLSDADADGILDYAAPANQATAKVDIPLLDRMQEKYTWLLGIIKKSYK